MPPIKATVPGVSKLLKGLNPNKVCGPDILAQDYYVSLVNRLLHLLQLYFNSHCTMVLFLGIGIKPTLHQFSRKGKNINVPITDVLVVVVLSSWNVCSYVIPPLQMSTL